MQFFRLVLGLAIILLAPIIVVCVAPVLFAMASAVMPFLFRDVIPSTFGLAKSYPFAVVAILLLLTFRRVILGVLWRPRKEEFQHDEW